MLVCTSGQKRPSKICQNTFFSEMVSLFDDIKTGSGKEPLSWRCGTDRMCLKLGISLGLNGIMFKIWSLNTISLK